MADAPPWYLYLLLCRNGAWYAGITPDLEARMRAHADGNQLEMALLNLGVNARDAMHDGGTLTLSARGETLESGHDAALPGGAYVVIAVADTGRGMDEATRRRAVEPFFTTKGEGEGTGLGLAIAKEDVTLHNGVINAWGELGKGSSFVVTLPRTAQSAVTEFPLMVWED